MKNSLLVLFVLANLVGCSWGIYNDGGHTRLQQKYPTGSSVVYEDGTYARDHRYNQYRPQPHLVDSPSRAQ